jgi:hypothetical protein
MGRAGHGACGGKRVPSDGGQGPADVPPGGAQDRIFKEDTSGGPPTTERPVSKGGMTGPVCCGNWAMGS